MVFTPDMCASRWSIGNDIIGHDGHATKAEVNTEAMDPKEIATQIGFYLGHRGVVMIYNIYRNYNKRPGDFLDGDYFAQSKSYAMPDDCEELVDDLADLSLTHKIIDIDHSEHGIGLLLTESENRTTNINAEVIAAVVDVASKENGREVEDETRRD